MSLIGKLKKRAKKAVTKYGKTAIRGAAAYYTGGASEMYYQKAQGFAKSAARRVPSPLQAAIPKSYRPSFGGGFGEFSRATSRGIVLGG